MNIEKQQEKRNKKELLSRDNKNKRKKRKLREHRINYHKGHPKDHWGGAMTVKERSQLSLPE